MSQADGSVMQERPVFNSFDSAIAWLRKRQPSATRELARRAKSK